jgi:hypothetical protein
VKNPLNPYDATAVDVKRLNGAMLGRVPTEHTLDFSQQQTFGSAKRLYYDARHQLCLDVRTNLFLCSCHGGCDCTRAKPQAVCCLVAGLLGRKPMSNAAQAMQGGEWLIVS